MSYFKVTEEDSYEREAGDLAEVGDSVVLVTQGGIKIRVNLKATSLLGTMSGTITSAIPEELTAEYGVTEGSNVAFDRKNVFDVFPR